MLTTDFLYWQNEIVVGLLIFLVMVVASVAGFSLGRWRAAQASAKIRAHVKEASTVSEAGTATKEHVNLVLTAIFGMLGLLLAFTFSMATSRYDSRKQALVQETNALGTAYLRTQFLPEPQRPAAVGLLRRYVDARLASNRPNWDLDTALRNETTALQQQLWSQAAATAQQDPQAITIGLYVQSLNDAIDAQGTRDAARLNTLPATALYLLFAASILGMGALGYAIGFWNGRSAVETIMLALLIAVVVVIIIDLDHPNQGFITISQRGLIELRQSMGK